MPATQDKLARPRSVLVIQVLFVLIGLLWGWVALRYLRLSEGGILGLLSNLAIAGLLFVKVLLMFSIGWGLPRYPRFFYPFAILVLAVDILLTVFDQMRAPDYINLGLDGLVLTLMFFNRNDFYPAN